MKESSLYLKFLKDFGVLFIFFGLIGCITSYYLLSKVPTSYIAERLYEFPYTLDNAAAVEKDSEQVVSVLRAPQLKEELGIQESLITVYKPGPFSLTLQVKSQNAENAVNSLSVISGYLLSKYQVNEIGKDIFFIEIKPTARYLFSGLISGEITALLFSLLISYFRRY